MRIALVHDFLVHLRGAERVFLALTNLFPTADLYLLAGDRRLIRRLLPGRRVALSALGRLPLARRTFRAWLPLYPYAIERFDLEAYDLVISSTMGFAHGVITQPATCHICCSHTPLRYAWSWYHRYLATQSRPASLLAQLVLHSIRQWDRQAVDRVDYLVAGSRFNQQRIRKYYRRDATLIHYPIDVSAFSVAGQVEDYYLVVSALMPYKRVDIAVQACNLLGLPLKVIGEGPEIERLRAMAGPNVEFLGSVTDEQLRRAYAHCRAFLFTPEEDYGLTPLEAQASGRPVIAYGAGGALETVVEGVTGHFFHQQTAAALAGAVARFDPARFHPDVIRQHALSFDVSTFGRQLTAFVQDKLGEYRRQLGISAAPRHDPPEKP